MHLSLIANKKFNTPSSSKVVITVSFSNQIYNTPSSLGVCEDFFIDLIKFRKDAKQWLGEMTLCLLYFLIYVYMFTFIG